MGEALSRCTYNIGRHIISVQVDHSEIGSLQENKIKIYFFPPSVPIHLLQSNNFVCQYQDGISLVLFCFPSPVNQFYGI